MGEELKAAIEKIEHVKRDIEELKGLLDTHQKELRDRICKPADAVFLWVYQRPILQQLHYCHQELELLRTKYIRRFRRR